MCIMIDGGTINDLLKAMFDESPLALDEYFNSLSEDDQTFAAGFINGFMTCMFMEDSEEE